MNEQLQINNLLLLNAEHFLYINGMFTNGQFVEVGSSTIVNTSNFQNFNQSKCQEGDVLVWRSSQSNLGEIQCQSREKRAKLFCLSGIMCGEILKFQFIKAIKGGDLKGWPIKLANSCFQN